MVKNTNKSYIIVVFGVIVLLTFILATSSLGRTAKQSFNQDPIPTSSSNSVLKNMSKEVSADRTTFKFPAVNVRLSVADHAGTLETSQYLRSKTGEGFTVEAINIDVYKETDSQPQPKYNLKLSYITPVKESIIKATDLLAVVSKKQYGGNEWLCSKVTKDNDQRSDPMQTCVLVLSNNSFYYITFRYYDVASQKDLDSVLKSFTFLE